MVGSGGRAIEKQQPIMTFVGVPFGKHKLLFESAGAILAADVNVQTHDPVQVRVDFSSEQVVIVGGTIDRAESGSAADEESAEAEPECIEYWVQVTRANSLEELEPIQDLLEDRGFPPYQQRIVKIEGDGVLPLYKLYIGPIEGKAKAKWAKSLVRHAGFTSAFVVPEKCAPRERRKRKFGPVP
jgi:cell division septation protein DedD